MEENLGGAQVAIQTDRRAELLDTASSYPWINGRMLCVLIAAFLLTALWHAIWRRWDG